MHGFGKYIGEDNEIYEGAFKNDKKHGKGKMTYPNGIVIEGSWKNGVLSTKSRNVIKSDS